MTHPRPGSRIATGLLVLAGLLALPACDDDAEQELVENVEVNGVEPEELIEELEGVDLSGLGGAERRLFIRQVNDLLSPCGDPVSVARCIDEGRECADCVHAASYGKRLVGEGFERHEIRELYRLRFDPETVAEIPDADSPVRGTPMGAAVTLVEFSDFECPFCGRAHPVLERIVREFDGQVRMVFKQYPLSMHEYADDASRATIAAGNQGKFWEMHDTLFEHQTALTPSDIEGYAEELGLDMERFRADMEAEATQAIIDRDRALGQELGVNSTPTIFVNGRKFEEPLENLGQYITEELARQ